MSGTVETVTPSSSPSSSPTTSESRLSANTSTPQGSALRAALVSEWTKLRSVRSTVWALVLTAVFTVGLSALFCWAFVNRDERRRDGSLRNFFEFDPTARSLRGVVLAQLAIGVLGVLVMSSEYTTGMIRTSLAAVPNRRILLAAKTLILTGVSLVVGMASAFVAFLLGQAILDGKALGASLGDPSVLRAILGAGLYLTLIPMFGLALGTIIRRTPGAIATLFGIVLILPLLADAFPEPWDVRIGRVSPLNAGQAFFSVRYDPDLLTPTQGLLVFLGWVVASFVVAVVMASKRDA